MGDKSSQRQFLVRVDGIDGLFATKAGGNITAEVSKAFDGGSTTPDLISAPPSADNVTTGRTYEPERDAPIMARLRPMVGSFRTTLSVTPTDADLVAVAPPTTYSNALLVGLVEPEANAGSGDAAMFELEWAISNFR